MATFAFSSVAAGQRNNALHLSHRVEKSLAFFSVLLFGVCVCSLTVCVCGATRQVKLVTIQRLLKNAWLPKMVVVSDSRARLSRYGSSSVKRKTVNSI